MMSLLSHAGNGASAAKLTLVIAHVIAADHAIVTSGLICIYVLGKEKIIKHQESKDFLP
jgi:hypothetical protein